MSNSLIIAGVDITTDAEGRFNLNALHRASGLGKSKAPNRWMRSEQALGLVTALEGVVPNMELSISPLNSIHGGGTFAVEQLAVAYASWISSEFYLLVINTFLAYRNVTAEKSASASDLSRMDILQIAMQAEKEKLQVEQKNVLLENRIEEDSPKVAFANQVQISEDAISVAQAAKIIGTGQKRLFAFLRRTKWVTRLNEPYQAKIDAGYLDVKLKKWTHPNDGLQQSVTAMVTGKGMTKLQQVWEQSRAELSL